MMEDWNNGILYFLTGRVERWDNGKLGEYIKADELNLKTLFFGDTFGILPDLFPKTLGKPGIIEDPDILRVEKSCHPLIVTPSGQGAMDDNTVVTGKNTGNALLVSFGK